MLPGIAGCAGALGASASGGLPGDLWQPSQLATLKIWLRGDDAGTVDGATISTWSDASGNSNNATAATSPTMDVTTGLNGHHTVKFLSSSTQSFTLPNVLGSLTAAAAVLVLKNVSDPAGADVNTGGPLKVGSQSGGSEFNHYPYTDSNIYDDFGSSSRKTVGNPTPSLANWHIASFHSQSASWKYYLNGTSFFSTGTNTVGWISTPKLGRQHRADLNTDAWYNGNLAELCLFSEFLSDANRQKVEGYLAYKYGLQSVLDVSHPYKSSYPT